MFYVLSYQSCDYPYNNCRLCRIRLQSGGDASCEHKSKLISVSKAGQTFKECMWEKKADAQVTSETHLTKNLIRIYLEKEKCTDISTHQCFQGWTNLQSVHVGEESECVGSLRDPCHYESHLS